VARTVLSSLWCGCQVLDRRFEGMQHRLAGGAVAVDLGLGYVVVW